ncbi:MAG: hypothetical protein O3A25_05815 [Acidobacteria bacterium]|nr:hypothetical protein [Acidobacteriota bacterium]
MGRKSRDSRRPGVAPGADATAPAPDGGRALAALALAWAIPGAGHLWLGRRQKGVVFLCALPVMFGLGLWLEGALAPFDATQPLLFLAACAALGNGALYLLASVAGWGEGRVVAATFEYGNTFLIVSGLLNMLIALDAYDVALGRK